MHFELIGEIERAQTLARGRGIRELVRLQRIYGRGKWRKPGKTRITIRIDDDVLTWFKAQVHDAGGGNYQSLINQVLREQMQKSAEPLEDTLRRVIREELSDAG